MVETVKTPRKTPVGTNKNFPTSKKIDWEKDKVMPSIKQILNPDAFNSADPNRSRINNLAQLILSSILNYCAKNEGLSTDGREGLNLSSAFISTNLIKGISFISQPISAENVGWNFGRTVNVICRYFWEWARNSYNFYCRDDLMKILTDIQKTVNSHYSHRDTPASKKMVNSDHKSDEMGEDHDAIIQKIDNILNSQLLGISKSNCNVEATIWEKCYEDSKYTYFKLTWLRILRQYLQMPSSAKLERV